MCKNSSNPAALLINSLQPKHRAILYQALLFVKHESEQDYARHVEQNLMAPTLGIRVAQFMKWRIDTIQETSNILFAECFPEDLELIKFFQQDCPDARFVTKGVGA